MPEFIDFGQLTAAQLQANPLNRTRSFDEVWAELSQRNATVSQVLEANQPSIQELIEQAKLRLAAGGTKRVDTEKLPTVEAGDAATVKQIHALADEAKRARDEAAAQYDALKLVLKDMMGDEETAAEVLTVSGVPIATWKKSVRTTLNQSAVKERFPQSEHPELYSTQETRTFLLK